MCFIACISVWFDNLRRVSKWSEARGMLITKDRRNDEKGNTERFEGHVWSEMSENPVQESEPKSKNPQVVERTPSLLPSLSPSKYALPSVTMATLSLPQADHMHMLTHLHMQSVCMQFHTYTVAPGRPRARSWTDTHIIYSKRLHCWLRINTLQLWEAEKLLLWHYMLCNISLLLGVNALIHHQQINQRQFRYLSDRF